MARRMVGQVGCKKDMYICETVTLHVHNYNGTTRGASVAHDIGCRSTNNRRNNILQRVT
jgi:hypothetical protein